MLEIEEGFRFPKALVGVNVGLACVDGIIAVLAFTQGDKQHTAVKEKMFQIMGGSCFSIMLVGVIMGLACIDAILAVHAFTQLIRIHSRNSQLGWTRQKVFHLLIGSSNAGYFIYFVLTLVAACKEWQCWSYSCGFLAMAFPRLLLFAAFLLLLSFWIDLCHPSNDEDDEEHGFLEALLKRSLNKPCSSTTDGHRLCSPFQSLHVGSRQKIVVLVTVLVFVFMMTIAVLIWIGMAENPIDSSLVTRVYVALFALAMLLLGGALAYYGVSLCLKMRTVRSARASAETQKVAGLAIVSVLCFTPSALIALLTEIPFLYHWHQLRINGVYASLLLILYYFIGSSVPSAFVLWVMRDLPPVVVPNRQDESRARIAFIRDDSAAAHHHHHPQRWTTATSAQNQIKSLSPI